MNLLLLAGTSEARELALSLGREAGLKLTVSLPRPSPHSTTTEQPARIGGWASGDAFRDWLLREDIDAIVDASHPFATTISRRAVKVASDLGIELVRVVRPPWSPTEGHKWTFVRCETDAARHIPPGATVFLATGRRVLHAFENLGGRRIYCRVKDDPGAVFPFEGGSYICNQGPFTVESERKLLKELGVDWLVIRNSGGSGGWPKLAAARDLGISVVMVERPDLPAATEVPTVEEASAWIRSRT